jgi:hypothetical protein
MHISKQQLLQIIQEEVKSELNESWWSKAAAALGLAGVVPDVGTAAEKLGTQAVKQRAGRGMNQVSSAFSSFVACKGNCNKWKCKGECPPCKEEFKKQWRTARQKGNCIRIEDGQ